MSTLKTDVSTLKTDVSILKTDVDQLKVGEVALFFVSVGSVAINFSGMKEMEKRSDAKMIAAEAKADAKMIAAEAKADASMIAMSEKMDKMFFVTSVIAIVPLIMSYYSNK